MSRKTNKGVILSDLGDGLVLRRSTRADAEALARVLGEVDVGAVKREGRSDIQHPIYSPLSEQWESFVQHLTKMKVRQATVKTADDRLATVWPEIVKDGSCTEAQLEETILALIKRHGKSFDDVYKRLVPIPEGVVDNGVFAE